MHNEVETDGLATADQSTDSLVKGLDSPTSYRSCFGMALTPYTCVHPAVILLGVEVSTVSSTV